jgi:hypothetical protein
METGEKKRWKELVGTGVVNGVTCAALTFGVVFLTAHGCCPAFLFILVFACPLLLMKWPMEVQSWVSGQNPREPDINLKIASVIGGYFGIFALILTTILALILIVAIECSNSTCV